VEPSPPPHGWGRARGGSADSGARYGDSLDGRLDLDRLDDDQTLDILGSDDDAPLLSERIRDALEKAGVLPWVRRHKAVTALVAGAVVLGLLGGGAWWTGRPVPLADPRVTVTTGGNEPARLIVDPATGQVTAITQLVLLTSDEQRGTTVTSLGVVGPGLTDPQSRVIVARPQDTVTGALTSQVDCLAPEATADVVGAQASDYRVLIRRTSALGEVRDDSVPLTGGEEWMNDVRAACVQIAADRDLAVAKVEATPLAGRIATDVRLLVVNRASSPWRALRVSTDAGPTIVSSGSDVDLAANGQAWVPVRLWPDDCSDPVAPLAGGVPLRATLVDDAPSAQTRAPTFTLPLDPSALDTIGRALVTTCSATAPTATVLRARVSTTRSDTSAGVITMWVEVAAPDAGLVEVDDLPAGPGGRVSAFETPVLVSNGVAQLHLAWELPQCFDVLAAGAPTLPLRLVVGDLRRPYQLELRGPSLELNLDRLCGQTVAGVVR
jgi:hypothetical protein